MSREKQTIPQKSESEEQTRSPSPRGINGTCLTSKFGRCFLSWIGREWRGEGGFGAPSWAGCYWFKKKKKDLKRDKSRSLNLNIHRSRVRYSLWEATGRQGDDADKLKSSDDRMLISVKGGWKQTLSTENTWTFIALSRRSMDKSACGAPSAIRSCTKNFEAPVEYLTFTIASLQHSGQTLGVWKNQAALCLYTVQCHGCLPQETHWPPRTLATQRCNAESLKKLGTPAQSHTAKVRVPSFCPRGSKPLKWCSLKDACRC